MTRLTVNHVFARLAAASTAAAGAASCTSHPPLDCGTCRRLAPPATPGTYSVATWNTWLLSWPLVPRPAARTDRIIEWLAAQDCDIVALQEVWTDRARDSIARGLADRYDALSTPEAEAAGLMLLVRKDRFRPRGADPVHAEPYEHEAGEEALAAKGFMRARLQDVAAPHIHVDVYATHLQADSRFASEATCRRTRERQAAQLAAFLARDAHPATPVLLMGDLNVERPALDIDGPHYPPLVHALQGTDPATHAPADDLYIAWLRGARDAGAPGETDCRWLTFDNWVNHTTSAKARRAARGKHLDYIFSMNPAAEVRVLDAHIHHPAWTTTGNKRRSLSDHYPLVLIIALPAPAGAEASSRSRR